MTGVNWASLITGIVTIGSTISMATGHPALAAVISNPDVATALTGVVGGIAGLVSLFAPAVLHSTTVAAADVIQGRAGK